LHYVIDATILQYNTLLKPAFKKVVTHINAHKKPDDVGVLEQFDFVVANPPFSTKSWIRVLRLNLSPLMASSKTNTAFGWLTMC
jgi:type I restriction-modification system DNA methylase subunit